jgi:predicted membrane-bound mannosyltransferase
MKQSAAAHDAGTRLQSSEDKASSERAFALGLTLTSLAPRLYAALAWAKEPVWDGHYYHFGATRIAAGLGYSEDIMLAGQPKWNPWCHYPVGYSGFLGGFYKVFGSHLWVAPLLNALVGAATVWLVYQLAKLCLSPIRARIAGVLCAVHPGLILYSAVVMSEPLAAASMLLAGYLAVRFSDKLYGPLLAGAALGCSVLVRPT